MRRRGLLCCLLVSTPALGAPGDDDRIAVTRPGAQFLPIGIVRGGARIAYATGFLVSACHVLTVKHAAGRVAQVVGRKMAFRLPHAGRGGVSTGHVVAAGTLDLVADPLQLDRSEDWMVLRLERCLGARFGHLALSEGNGSSPFRMPHQRLSSAGFPIDRSWRRQLTIDPQCRVRRSPGRVLFHDCVSLPGNSGSPIFATTRNGARSVIEVVAMQSTAAVTNRPRPFQVVDGGVATRMIDILPAIRGYLALPPPPSSALAAAPRQPGRGMFAVPATR